MPSFAYLLIRYVFCVQRYISFCTLPIIFSGCRFFYRFFTITMPTFRYLTLLRCGFRWRHTIKAPVRTAHIIKRHRFRHLLLYLIQRGKLQSGKNSFFIVLLIRSATALSFGLPLSVILIVMPLALNACTYWWLAYCTPRSEWCVRPL